MTLFIAALILLSSQIIESTNFFFKGLPHEALDWFNEVAKFENVKTRVHCGHYILSHKDKETGAYTAFKHDAGSNSCYVGNLGPFAGDIELLQPDNSMSLDRVYIRPNCFAKSSNLGTELKFFFSFLDDNVQKVGIFNFNGSHHRLQNPAWDGVTDYGTWAASDLTIVDAITFKIPRSATFPAFFSLSKTTSIQFETDPITISSFSIFAWMYFPSNTHYDGVLAFGETADYKKPAFNFFIGWTYQAGKPQCALSLSGTMKRYIGTSTFPSKIWTYVGMVFNAPNATITFYSDGTQIGNILTTVTGFIGIQWENLRYINLGTNYATTRTMWSPRATVELHDKAMTQTEVQTQSLNANYFLNDLC